MTGGRAGGAAASRLQAATLSLLACACGEITSLPPAPGELKVLNSTSGVPIPTEPYAITLDGVNSSRLEINGSHVFSNLAPGEHTLELSQPPVDCRITGNNPRTVTAAAGDTVLSVFLVTCIPPNSGSLSIRTATYGRGPDEYEISVDNGLFSEVMGATDELTLFPVTVGVHMVSIAPIHSNCQLIGFNPRIVIIRRPGGIGDTIFKVHCPE